MLRYHDILLIHAGVTLFMVGLIWVIQVVHYPLFASVGSSHYEMYQSQHMQRISWVVMPVMLAELSCALWLVFIAPSHHTTLVRVALCLLALIWLSTATLQVPAHGKLTESWSAQAHQRLVYTNWIRTISWSVRGVIALMLSRV